MSKLDLSSQVTFLYYDDIELAAEFYEDFLGLERTYDVGYAYIWRTAAKAFVGAVDVKETTLNIQHRGGVLVSLTVHNIEEVEKMLKTAPAHLVSDLEPLVNGSIVPIKSIFFTGPGGYKYEIQQFTDPKIIEIF